MRGPHPVAERPALRHPPPHPAESDSAQEFVSDAVENEKRKGLVPNHVVVLALEAPAKCGARQVVVRPRWFPMLKKTAASGSAPPAYAKVPQRPPPELK